MYEARYRAATSQLILSRRNVRGRILAGPDEFSGGNERKLWQKRENSSDKDLRPPTHREVTLVAKPHPDRRPGQLTTAQRDRCLVLLVIKRVAVNRPR